MSNIEDNKTIPGAVLHLVKEAWRAECWIYDSQIDSWYTPEEFKENWKTLYHDESHSRNGRYDRYKVMNPYRGLADRLNRLNKSYVDMNNYRKKLEDYFTLKGERKNSYKNR